MDKRKCATVEGRESAKKYIKRDSGSILNPKLFEEDLKNNFAEAFKKQVSYRNDECGVELVEEPYACAVVQNLISDLELLKEIQKELLQLDFHNKSNDLYQFKQTDDLKKNDSKAISKIRDCLFKDFVSWLNETTQIELNETIDLSCSKYEYTDVLLCHDDELEGRRIAFIYYLVPDDWSSADGGNLDLYTTDENGLPGTIQRTITPKYNSLIFFEVTPKSFHQVSEILSKDKLRLSLVGWFHGTSVPRPSPFLEQPPQKVAPVLTEDELLLSWVNPTYLNPEIVASIQEQFEENSEIQLTDFLLEDKFKTIEEELLSEDIYWEKQGPPNKRFYSSIKNLSHCPNLSEFVSLMSSTPMFKLITKLTDLELANLYSEDEDSDETPSSSNETSSVSSARCSREVRRWQHGCYTLVHDGDPCGEEYALDALIYFRCGEWDNEAGGYTTYLANGEDEELLTVQPMANCLSLVYRDKDTLRFTKHVNHRSTELNPNHFYDVSITYFE